MMITYIIETLEGLGNVSMHHKVARNRLVVSNESKAQKHVERSNVCVSRSRSV